MRRIFVAVWIVLCFARWVHADVPIGFQVLGTTVPTDAESIPPPEGWIERTPTGLQTELPALTAAETKRGYLIFRKHYLEMVYPGTRPMREEITESLTIFSTAGEYEIATLSCHALTDLSDVRVTASALTSNHHTIAAENIQIRSVRCMPNRVWGEAAYTVRPTLLELREHVDIPAKTTQRYWITVWVPRETPPGQYTGAVTIQTQGVKAHTLALSLEVLPIELQSPPIRQGMYVNFVIITKGLINMPPLPEDQLRKQLVDLQQHGMNTLFVSFGPTLSSTKRDGRVRFDLTPIEPFARICKEVGISKIIHNVWTDEFIDNSHGKFETCVQAFVGQWRERDWPELILSAGDEADANGTLPKVMNAFRKLRKVLPDTRIYTTVVFPKNSEVFEPLVDIRAFSSYADETVIAKTRQAGRSLWMYSGSSDYGAGGRGDRLYRGLWAVKLELEGALDWTYWQPSLDHTQPFNDLIDNGSSRPNFSGWIFPTDTGPLPTTGWESMREGVEDGRYVYTLQQAIKERRQRHGADDSLASAAESFLQAALAQIDISPRPRKPDGTPDNTKFTISLAAEKLSPDFFDRTRRGMADWIVRLEE